MKVLQKFFSLLRFVTGKLGVECFILPEIRAVHEGWGVLCL